MLTKKEIAIQKEQEVKDLLKEVKALKRNSSDRYLGLLSKYVPWLFGFSILAVIGVVLYSSRQ